MAQIDEAQVRHIARLARLSLTDGEVRQFADELAAVVTYVSQLANVNTEGVEALAHPLPAADVLRPDTPHAPLNPEQALANAPSRINDCFDVPAVLDGAHAS